MKKLILTGACLLAGAAACNALAKGKLKTDNFIEEASAKGLAEIAMAKIALNKSSSASVKEFAQKMIDDHTAANDGLKGIARMKNLKMADDVRLMNKAKALILKQREGESFDVAYANNQVSAHEKAIKLFREASYSKDSEIKDFAEKTLPKLERRTVNRTAIFKNQKNIAPAWGVHAACHAACGAV